MQGSSLKFDTECQIHLCSVHSLNRETQCSWKCLPDPPQTQFDASPLACKCLISKGNQDTGPVQRLYWKNRGKKALYWVTNSHSKHPHPRTHTPKAACFVKSMSLWKITFWGHTLMPEATPMCLQENKNSNSGRSFGSPTNGTRRSWDTDLLQHPFHWKSSICTWWKKLSQKLRRQGWEELLEWSIHTLSCGFLSLIRFIIQTRSKGASSPGPREHMELGTRTGVGPAACPTWLWYLGVGPGSQETRSRRNKDGAPASDSTIILCGPRALWMRNTSFMPTGLIISFPPFHWKRKYLRYWRI